MKTASSRKTKKPLANNKIRSRNIAECFGENLHRLRKQHHLSQAELATRAGISKGFLQSLEKGRRWVSPQTLKMIAHELNVTQSELFRDCEAELHMDSRTLLKSVAYALGLDIPHEVWNHVRQSSRRMGRGINK